jgi:ATP-dependent Clp protease protease subunit
MTSKKMTAILATVALAILPCARVIGRQAPATPSQRQIVIVFNGMITDVSIAHLIATVDDKLKHGATAFTLLISSNGGSIDPAVTAYSYLKGIPATVTTHNFGGVDSAAVILYCAGSRRMATPDARFTIHGISINPSAGSSFDENQLTEALHIVQNQAEAMATIIARTAGKPLAAVKDAIIARTIFTAERAKDWSLVSAIEGRLYDDGAEVIIVPIQ